MGLADVAVELPMNQRNNAVALGSTMTGGMLVFAGAGIYADRRFGRHDGLFTLAGMFLGLFFCGYEVWKLVRVTDESSDDDST
jgi:hypothetical protein